MDFPETLRYTSDHEWARKEDDGTVSIGITEHATDQLGDITAVELPDVGDAVEAGERLGDIDSVKTVSDLIAPVSGEIVARNDELEDSPELINEEPYGKGWMVRIKPSNPGQLDDLLDAQKYRALVASEAD